jgi:tetratricopeptide (TPR) repeat protein
MGIGFQIEPVVGLLKRLLQRHEPVPVQANYSISYQALDQGQWRDLRVPKRQQVLGVSDDLLHRFREDRPYTSIRDLAASLKRFLFSTDAASEYGRLYEAAGSSRSEFIFAVSAGPRGIQGLANVPWELTAEPGDPEMLIGLNPRVTLCRLIESPISRTRVSHQGPLKVFYVISNREPRFDREAEAYQQTLCEFGERKQPVVAIGSPGSGLRPTFGDALQSINAFSPHILIYVGHGRTENGQAQLKFEDWVDARDLADEITPLCNELFLVILISCDTSWAAALDPYACGPQAFISNGLPAVVTMQSKIKVNYAHRFLDRLLSSLFSGASLPRCVTVARQGDLIGAGGRASRDLQWAAPALFVSKAAFEVIQPLSAWREAYAVQLSAIETSFPAVGETVRRHQLEATVSNWLDDLTGVACIEGIFGSGRTTLVSKVCRDRYRIAAREFELPSRPVIYLDIGEIPEPSLGAVLSAVDQRSQQYGLPPVSYQAGGRREEHVVRFADLQEVVLILDDADLLSQEELLSLLKYSRRHLDHGLLILIVGTAGSIPVGVQQIPVLRVRPLNPDGVIRYCTTLVGQNGRLANEWYAASGGNLYLLSLLRLRGNTLGLRPGSLSNPDDLTDAAKTFVRALRPSIPPHLYDLLANVAALPGGLDKNWLAEIFGSDASRQYEELSSQGLATSRRRYGREWVQPSTLARLGLKSIEADLRRRRLMLDRCRAFADDYGPGWGRVERFPHELVEDYPGFVRLFQGLQLLSLAVEQHDYAVGLTRLLFQALRRAGRILQAMEVIETLLENERMELWVPEDLLRLAWALGAMGDTIYLATVLDFLECFGIDRMSDYDRVTFWNLRANCLKDRAATDRVSEMLELYDRAEALARSHLPTEGRRPKDWLEQLALTYHNRALALRYMRGDLSAARQALEQAATLFKEADLLVMTAKSRMEKAEIQLDIPDQVPDWSEVEDLLLSARDTFLKSRSQSNLAFCLYQLGRLYRKNPVPDVCKAIAAYDECRAKAEKAGLHRLAAIALRHRVELAWRRNEMSSDEAIGMLDLAIRDLQHFIGDAWSTRVLRDAQFLAARILLQGTESEAAMARLRGAWSLAFEPPLHPQRTSSDRLRAAAIGACWIERFGWSEDPDLVAGLRSLLHDDLQPDIALVQLEQISGEVE